MSTSSVVVAEIATVAPETDVATSTPCIQFPRMMHVAGTVCKHGIKTPYKVCGYAFTIEEVLEWMDKHGMRLKGYRCGSDRFRDGWTDIRRELRAYDICYEVVRVKIILPGEDKPWKRYGQCLSTGNNADVKARKGVFSRKKIEAIHRVLRCNLGELGGPKWYTVVA